MNNCQKCKQNFEITDDDKVFYQKMGVPEPTFCPRCRMVRRMANTNERVLYKRTCDLTGKNIISMFPPGTTFPVYEVDSWYGDDWDPSEYGMDYDFSKPFFEQFLELQNKVPRMSLVRQGYSINSEYCHRVNDPKNSYMVFRFTKPEDSMYLYAGADAKDCMDSSFIWKSELCYDSVDVTNCYRVLYGQELTDCRDSYFIYGCHNVSNCVLSVNLRNCEYCIWNEQYGKEEYFEKLKELGFDKHENVERFRGEFDQFRKKFPQRAVTSLKINDCSGNWLNNCEKVFESYGCSNVKDGKYLFIIFNAEECMDFFQWGNKAELVYESENCGINVRNLFSCSQCWMGAHDLMYSDSCPGASNCFGCIGLKKGEYSILNKRYEKEEYFEMIEKIKKHMVEMPYFDNDGTVYKFGEHFPNSISPFAFNETAAVDFFDIKKDEAQAKGFVWKDKEKVEYPVSKKWSDLPETISEVVDDITKEIISCEKSDLPYSPGAFKITPDELNFYRKLGIPLPRKSFPVRYMERLLRRPNIETIDRLCSKCSKDVKTVYTESYSPILYCESCYQEEVL
jgi:hypothetical protein